MFGWIKNKLEFRKFKKKWRADNGHNETEPINRFFADCVQVGRRTYGGLYVLSFNKDAKLQIGSYCSIAPEVSFMLSADHSVDHISTYPFKVKVLGEEMEGITRGDIVVEDDVWIGYRATILSGVHIGRGAIVAAGAVVSRDVPAYSVVAGVPAKVIKYRFSQDIIDELQKLDYNSLSDEWIRENIALLYRSASMEEVQEVLTRL